MAYVHSGRSKNLIVRAAISVSLAGLVSGVHHWYGALVYETPWRLVVSLWIPAFVLLVLAMLYVHWTYADKFTGKIAVWAVFFVGVVFQTGFTLFECVYSHVLKDLLFYGGASRQILERLFPAPAYHLPDSLIFESTGLLQLVGFWAAWMAYRVFSERPQEE